MEILAFVVIAGLIGWWFYRNIDGKKSLDNSQNSALFGAERFSRTEPAKVDTPGEIKAVQPTPPVEATAEPDPVVAKTATKAKKPPAMKKGPAPKAVVKSKAIAKPMAKKPAKK